MSKGNGLHRHYDRLEPDERFRLDVLAMARGDKTESERLVRSCPRHTYTMTEVGFSGRWHAAIDITALTYSDLARFMDKLDMVDAFRELIPYSRTLIQDVAFDAYLEGHEAGSRHAWGYAGMEGFPPAWPDEGPNGELMEPDEDERDPAMERDLDELEAKAERYGEFLPEILERLERALTAQALAVWQAFAAFCVEELGVEAMKVVRAYYNQSEVPDEYPGRVEGLLERATRLGAEADASAVEEYRGCMAEAWAKIGRLGLR